MTHLDAPGKQTPCDQQSPVAANRVFFTAHQTNTVPANTLEEPLDPLLVRLLLLDYIIKDVAGRVITARCVWPTTQVVPQKQVFD